MTSELYNKLILEKLDELQIPFETEFEKFKSDGGKSILFKDKSGFRIFTIRADKEIDNKKVRSILKSQKLRFATNEELLELCGVVSGALPPLGRPFVELDHYIDINLLENEYIAFNAAILGHRIRIKVADFNRMVKATLCDFQKL